MSPALVRWEGLYDRRPTVEHIPEHTRLTSDGAWCWFQGPRAVRRADSKHKTYTDWLTRKGDVVTVEYDHRVQETTRTVLHEGFERDDHDAPSLYVNEEGRIVAFYTRHNGPSIRYRRSRRPEDVSAFGPEQVISPSEEHTYPNPRRFGDSLFLFYRNVDGTLATVVSRDDGRTWGDERAIVTTGGREWGVYFRLSEPRNGGIEMALIFAEGGQSNPHEDIRHLRFEDDQVLTASGGTVAHSADLPVEFWAAPAVHATDATGTDAWVWDCSLAAGVPEVLYAHFRSEEEHAYRYARWTGDGWNDTVVSDAGSSVTAGDRENYYSAGACLDPDRPGVCYCAVGGPERSELRRVRVGEGVEPLLAQERIAGRAFQNLRPVVPWNRRDDASVLWMRGPYNHYRGEEYETGIHLETCCPRRADAGATRVDDPSGRE